MGQVADLIKLEPFLARPFSFTSVRTCAGAFTMALGVLSIFLIIDFPDKNTFLTAEETEMVMTMLDKDRGDATPDVMTRGKVIKHMTCWRTWCYGLCFMNSTLPVSRPCRRR